MRTAAAALVLLLGLLLALLPPPPDVAWLHPVAPPLTHIPALAEPTLGPPSDTPPSRGFGLRRAVEETVRAVGTPQQRAEIDQLGRAGGALGQKGQRAQALRVAVEVDVARLGDALGPDRIAVILASRDGLSTSIGEGRVWGDAADRLAR